MSKDQVVYSTEEVEKEAQKAEPVSTLGLCQNKDGEWEIEPWLL
jgi:hypothetical protein